jgi:hypothetical protein
LLLVRRNELTTDAAGSSWELLRDHHENQRRTAAYNSQATIAYAIESFLAQKHPDKEMLVIEGMSDDDTVKIVSRSGLPISVSCPKSNAAGAGAERFSRSLSSPRPRRLPNRRHQIWKRLRSRRQHLHAPCIDAALFLRLIRRGFQLRKIGS